MLAAFLPPYPFRAVSAPYLWCYYRLLDKWADEPALFITGRDYVQPAKEWEGRWELDVAVQARLGYHLPDDVMPGHHHYAWLDDERFGDWLDQVKGNPIEAFRRFLCERNEEYEAELAALIDAAPERLEAVVTICNVPSLEAVCAARNIPVIHVELGSLRGPLYRETSYVDFQGVNGHSECAQRYSECTDWDPALTTDALLSFFLTHPYTRKQLPTQISHECGVALQVEDDSNLVAYGNGMDNLALLAAARQQVVDHELLVRPHPGSPFTLKSAQVQLDTSPNSLTFVARCHRLLTINSSVGLEAILLDKPLSVWGDNSYDFILDAEDEAERIRRLSFYLFGYLVPFSLQLQPEYLRFRLAQPNQHAIILRHISEYMKQENLELNLFENSVASVQAVFSVQYINLVREHRAEALAWKECEAELTARLDEQSAQHAKHVSDYEAELVRQHQESLSLIERADAASGRVVELEARIHKQEAHFEAWQQRIRTSLSWRLTMPLRVMGRLLRGDIASLRQGWRELCNEGGRRGSLARRLNQWLRPITTVARQPSLLVQGWHSLRQKGVVATWQRVRHVLGKHSHHVMPEIISLGEAAEVVILTTTHCRYLAELMRASLAKVDVLAEIRYQMPEEGYRNVLHIVICPQMFPSLPSQYIAYQLEQSVSSRWFTDDYLNCLEHSVAIFDYSLRNIAFLQEKGLSYRQLYHLPVGYLAKSLPEPVDETVDVLFYGDINNDRRRAYIAELKQYFTVKVINDLFGDELYAEMAKAKVIVNIHYYEGALLETTRLYECLSQNRIIVSEEGVDMEEQSALLPLVDFVPINDIEAMLERVRYWVADDQRRTTRRAELTSLCTQAPDWFSYYFLRAFLSHDLITYEQFYQAAGNVIQLDSDMICLGLPETVARRADFDKDNHYGIQYFPGLRHRLGWVGCGLSYKFLLHRAKDLGLERVMICEDDIEFPEQFLNSLTSINGYLNHREDWDLFSGLIANLHQDTQVLECSEHNGKKYVVIDKMTSTVMNIYSKGFYDKLLGWDDRNHDAQTNTIDRYIENRSGLRVITNPTFLVGHKEELNSTLWGFSNITYREMIADSEALLGQKLEAFCSRQ